MSRSPMEVVLRRARILVSGAQRSVDIPEG
jgi:hypothetical protein